MSELVTINTILDFLLECIEQKKIVDAHTWIDASQKLNILLSDEHDELFSLQQKVAQDKVTLIEEGLSVAHARVKVEATDVYREMRSQAAKIGRIEETIRISKIQSKLKDNELRSYNL